MSTIIYHQIVAFLRVNKYFPAPMSPTNMLKGKTNLDESMIQKSERLFFVEKSFLSFTMKTNYLV